MMTVQWTTVYLGLGSNMGEPAQNVSKVIRWLDAHTTIRQMSISSFYHTEPVGPVDDQPWFLNAVVRFQTSLNAEALMAMVRDIEEELGRNRDKEIPGGPRVIDIDVLFFGDQVINKPEMTIPHPRLHQREFVLRPMCDIASQWVHPKLKKTMAALLADLMQNAEADTQPDVRPLSLHR